MLVKCSRHVNPVIRVFNVYLSLTGGSMTNCLACQQEPLFVPYVASFSITNPVCAINQFNYSHCDVCQINNYHKYS